MSPNLPSSPGPSSSPSAPTPAARKRRWLLYGCGGLLALLLLLVATVLITLCWIQRPIKPVVLSAREKAQVEAKLRQLELESPAPPAKATPRLPEPATEPRRSSPPSSRVGEPVELPNVVVPDPSPQPQDRLYTPGAKVLRLTEREMNGLLNANTDLGKSVRLEFAEDAINAYLAVPIPEDFPIGGGKMFRARGRFRVSIGNDSAPYAILEDVTVFGLSLPKAWLGGLKGENLLGRAMGEGKQSRLWQGIKSLRVEPGALVLEVQD